MAKITYVEYGETSTKNYQAKRFALGAEVQDGEDADTVTLELVVKVKDFMSGRKAKAQKLRKMADMVERGEGDIEEIEG